MMHGTEWRTKNVPSTTSHYSNSLCVSFVDSCFMFALLGRAEVTSAKNNILYFFAMSFAHWLYVFVLCFPDSVVHLQAQHDHHLRREPEDISFWFTEMLLRHRKQWVNRSFVMFVKSCQAPEHNITFRVKRAKIRDVFFVCWPDSAYHLLLMSHFSSLFLFMNNTVTQERDQLTLQWYPQTQSAVLEALSIKALNAYLIKNATGNCSESHSWREEFSCLSVYLVFTRDKSFYFTTVFVPGMVLVTSSFISFWLDVNAVPARVMIGVTTMLNFCTTTNR